jgi:hypothetical protein
LVKWKGYSLEDSTWELEDNIKHLKKEMEDIITQKSKLKA